jgi:hypothetical protein
VGRTLYIGLTVFMISTGCSWSADATRDVGADVDAVDSNAPGEDATPGLDTSEAGAADALGDAATTHDTKDGGTLGDASAADGGHQTDTRNTDDAAEDDAGSPMDGGDVALCPAGLAWSATPDALVDLEALSETVWTAELLGQPMPGAADNAAWRIEQITTDGTGVETSLQIASGTVPLNAGKAHIPIADSSTRHNRLCVVVAVDTPAGAGCPALEVCHDYVVSTYPITIQWCGPAGTALQVRMQQVDVDEAVWAQPTGNTCDDAAQWLHGAATVSKQNPSLSLSPLAGAVWQTGAPGCSKVRVLTGEPAALHLLVHRDCASTTQPSGQLSVNFGLGGAGPAVAVGLSPGELRYVATMDIDESALALLTVPTSEACHVPEPATACAASTTPIANGLPPTSTAFDTGWCDFPCAGAVDAAAAGWPFVAGQCGCGP